MNKNEKMSFLKGKGAAIGIVSALWQFWRSLEHIRSETTKKI